MKKAITFLLLISILLMCHMPLLSATEPSEDHATYEQLSQHSIMYSCVYDAENKKIVVSGTVNHDVMITHGDFTILLYRILPGESVSDVMDDKDISPLSSTAIAIKFQFSVSASRVEERFSRYAIVLSSSDGEKILAAEPQYVGTDTNYTYDMEDRSSFKGIFSEKTSIAGSLGFGTAVIPVYMNQAMSKVSHGYLYLLGDTYHYFDQTYIEKLDAQIRTYSASGTRVYLQLLLDASELNMSTSDANDLDALYALPDIFSKSVLSSVCALSEFLSSRYDQYQNGILEGIIVGKQIDRQKMNYNGGLTLQEYAEKYAFYVLVVANSVRLHQPTLDIVIPLGNVNVYTEKTGTIDSEDYIPSDLLEAVLSIFEDRFSMPMPCNVLIESSTIPFDISNEMIDQGTIDTAVPTSDDIHTENLYQFIEYLHGLQKVYNSAPQHVMYVWTVSDALCGNSLACAYAYSYYRLLQENTVSSFVVSFEETEKTDEYHSLVEIQKIIRYINTDKSFEVTEHLLPYFNADTWSRVVGKIGIQNTTHRSVYLSSVLEEPNRVWTGTFSYVNFESGDIVDWFAGNACKKISFLYGMDGTRGLSATLQKTENDEYSELLCLYQYPENFVYTPMMKFSVALTDHSLSSDSLYEVIVTIGDETSSLTSEYLISGNSLTDLWIDVGKYSELHLANYIKISARMLHGDAEEYALWVYGVEGLSEEYSSNELSTLITAERMRIRDEALQDDEDNQNRDLILMVFGILLTVTIVGVGLYIGLYRTQSKVSEQETDEDTSKKT